ncbi:MAG: hypothetical protein NVSMB14_01060 [Isosphaeraceae bacterium]
MTALLLDAQTKPKTWDWKRWPETEAFVDELIAETLEGNEFAANLARRMTTETGTRFVDWVDHLVVARDAVKVKDLEALGYAREATVTHGSQNPVFHHEGGIFPRLAIAYGNGRKVLEVAIKVESIADFSRAHDLGLVIIGPPLGPYRIGRIDGPATSLAIVERLAYRGFEPYSGEAAREGRMSPHSSRDLLAARELWHGRKRTFETDEEGFDETEKLVTRLIESVGRDPACHVIFQGERDYWQTRNRAAQTQKARQDRLGLGWANHDHHTFRCSRKFFPRTMDMFKQLGFYLRERFHAGEHAGWGAQVLEHPTTGIVIFADLDLAPEEANDDFSSTALPDLARPNTVGLWVGLHGESILDAGMHHLEAQFDFDELRDGLAREANIETMKPFSNFPFLRQAFTAGERWPVAKLRADRALSLGWIDADQHARFLKEGAIGSHLENLQRREGYKGFNQHAVSAIIADTDPRLQHRLDC